MDLTKTARRRQMRFIRMNEQRGRCFYCGNAMWEREIEPREDALRRFNPYYPDGDFHSDGQVLEATTCTLEHKHRQAEGGTDAVGNLVAACARCNSRRNDLAVEDVIERVMQTYALPESGRSHWPDALTNTMIKRKHTFHWQRLVCVEASVNNVSLWRHTVSLEGGSNPSGNQIAVSSDDALVFPAAHIVPREIAYIGRTAIAGVRVLFENSDHGALFEQHYRGFVVFSTNNAAQWRPDYYSA